MKRMIGKMEGREVYEREGREGRKGEKKANCRKEGREGRKEREGKEDFAIKGRVERKEEEER